MLKILWHRAAGWPPPFNQGYLGELIYPCEAFPAGTFRWHISKSDGWAGGVQSSGGYAFNTNYGGQPIFDCAFAYPSKFKLQITMHGSTPNQTYVQYYFLIYDPFYNRSGGISAFRNAAGGLVVTEDSISAMVFEPCYPILISAMLNLGAVNNDDVTAYGGISVIPQGTP